MQKPTYCLLIVIVFGVTGWFANTLYKGGSAPIQNIIPIVEKPLEKYTIDALSKTEIKPSQIEIGEILVENPTFTSHLFSMTFNPSLQQKSGQETKKVTGLINLPKGEGPFPIVVLFRGYVDQATYKAGDGTRSAGEYFAKNGFITIAPDFLGYGESDPEAANIFESRFQTYTTALTLIKSVNSISQWNQKDIFLWGHSNGGQIALTILEITGATYPTVLWAPVSKPFPYSILYYTDESDDRGKLIRHELAKLEDLYDVEKFSLINYFDRIKAPISLHQGTLDAAVPKDWSDELAKKLDLSAPKRRDLAFGGDYFIYPGADHNLNPNWNLAISRSLNFFQEHRIAE